MPRRPLLVEGLTALGLIAAPFVLPYLGFAPNTVNQILVWGLFGIGFDILFGYTGLLSFGQSAFYGTGGFIAAYLLTNDLMSSVLAALVVGTVGAAPVGIVVGADRAAAYRHLFRDDHGRDRRDVLSSSSSRRYRHWTGGENGLPGVPTPQFEFARLLLSGQQRLVDVRLPRRLLLHRNRHRAAHRALAGRRDPERDPRQPAACARGRPLGRPATS